MATLRAMGANTTAIGVRFWVAESNGCLVACLGEYDDQHGTRWITDWYGNGSRIGKVGLSRLQREFEARAKSQGVHRVRGMAEPQATPNLLLFAKRGWHVVGVIGEKVL